MPPSQIGAGGLASEVPLHHRLGCPPGLRISGHRHDAAVVVPLAPAFLPQARVRHAMPDRHCLIASSLCRPGASEEVSEDLAEDVVPRAHGLSQLGRCASCGSYRGQGSPGAAEPAGLRRCGRGVSDVVEKLSA